MKELFIGTTWSPCVGFKCWCHENKIYLEYWYQDHQFEEIHMIWSRRRNEDKSFCVELNWSHALAYMLSHKGSWSWEFDYKRRILDMALCQGHDGLVSWAMVDQDIEHSIKFRILYLPQESSIEHEKIQG
jgi:hypothetical protein